MNVRRISQESIVNVSCRFVNLRDAITTAGSFWLFGGMCALGFLFAVFLLPETKDKTPEEVQAFFGTKPPSQTDEEC